MAANQKNEMTANLVEFRGTWRFCIHYKDENRKRRQKWIDTKLPIRGNKRNAQAMKQDVLAEWIPKLLEKQQSVAISRNLDVQEKEHNPNIQEKGATYGLRRSKLAVIKWDAIDFQRKTITVKASAVHCKVDGKYVTVVKPVLKNKSSYRTFPLTTEVEAALVAEKTKQEKNLNTYRRKYNMEFADHVFVNTLGELVKPNYFSKHFKLVLKKNNLKDIRFHDLRHTYVKAAPKNILTFLQ